MKLVIRFIQLLLILEALNQVYGAVTSLGLSVYGGQGIHRGLVGAAATILFCGLVAFLLQKYLETKYAGVPTIGAKKFLGLGLAGLAVVAGVGLAIVVLLLILALSRWSG